MIDVPENVFRARRIGQKRSDKRNADQSAPRHDLPDLPIFQIPRMRMNGRRASVRICDVVGKVDDAAKGLLPQMRAIDRNAAFRQRADGGRPFLF